MSESGDRTQANMDLALEQVCRELDGELTGVRGVMRSLRRENEMPYALFEDESKVSRAFPTKEEAIKKADEAGLLEIDANGKPTLVSGLTIKPCSPDEEKKSDEDLDWVPNTG
ncbi:hypothetical protein [Bradyrhizobium sp. sBnM-33]|uniref:hypothetical protein n=1 Tax=Bradyrhizobium sp. sBnM-33 TaxID=2831780 RepID=UPI0020BF49D0|nr:hypothetical protein [Bradyrhizobium sp. sBnM-33]WOH53809.1 hypothetical protein RX328_17985 [Bradyrhizobium sp. sBnM-33]